MTQTTASPFDAYYGCIGATYSEVNFAQARVNRNSYDTTDAWHRAVQDKIINHRAARSRRDAASARCASTR